MATLKNTARRLNSSSSAVVNFNTSVDFTFEGKRYQGLEGDSLASALIANGVKVFGNSYKYGRPRGVTSSYAEEPNALISLESGGHLTPNAKATQIELYDNLKAKSPTAGKGFFGRIKPLMKPFQRFLPAGFYYKTFMYPASLWMTYEKILRGMAGISESPTHKDLESYDHMHQHCDILVVGGGVAGLQAALTAAEQGKEVLLVDERPILGGLAYEYHNDTVETKPVLEWVKAAIRNLEAKDNVTILKRTTAFSFHDNNNLQAVELCQDHLPLKKRNQNTVRQRLHKIKATDVVLATGAIERPIAFHNNDLPGVMLASAVSSLINRFAVLPGQKLTVFTNNDAGICTALDAAHAGASVILVDVRKQHTDEQRQQLADAEVTVMLSTAVRTAHGKKSLTSVTLQNVNVLNDGSWKLKEGTDRDLSCDILAVSGGWSPVVHLDCHTGSKPFWSDDIHAFMPALQKSHRSAAGALIGEYSAERAAISGVQAISHLKNATQPDLLSLDNMLNTQAIYRVPTEEGENKLFIDLQNDVTNADIELAIRENYRNIEHVKRYTALGFGTDQGKTGNVLGAAITAEIQGLPMSQVGTTTFRPAYTPVAFGALAGQHVFSLFDPERYTPMHQSHIKNGAKFEEVGQWMRPWYFPRGTEDLHTAVNRESLDVRKTVGIMDASTLGKIDIQGPDAREFLNRVYTNSWTKLAPGNCRYGLMLDENGMISDDGVTACINDNHFVMTTTTGGAASVYQWLELWLQTEWPELKVYLTSVTDHWSTTALVGPDSRKLIEKMCDDVDFSADAFPFMAWREGTVLGVPARIMRISFSGELAFEINVQANYGRYIWDNAMSLGKEFDITPYGTETMHVLRAEKGYIIVGQDTDGSVSPIDANMSWIVANKKPFSFLGKRSLSRSDTTKEGRKQLVGLFTQDATTILPEGCQLINAEGETAMLGHVTSSYYSPIMGRPIAMAVVKGGLNRMGESIVACTREGKNIPVEITSSVFYDPKGERKDG